MQSKPYVGVTGFTTPEQVREAQQFFHQTPCGSKNLMVGFLVSYRDIKPLLGKEPDPPRDPNSDKLSMPQLDAVLNAVTDDPAIMRTIHYNTGTEKFSKEVIPLLDHFKGNVDAIQLNIVTPKVSEIAKIKQTHPKVKIIFQLNHHTMEKQVSINNTEKRSYLDVNGAQLPVDFCLIDPSGGQGIVTTPELFAEWGKKVETKLPQCTIGIAGGFKPQTIGTFASRFPSYSYDVESGVKVDIPNDKRLDMNKVKTYIKNACQPTF